ncbi:MAG: O-antigen ligase family protein [Pseudomonadota bacterium]
MEFRRLHSFLHERGLLYVYSLFIAGYFLLPMASGHRRLYYLFVFPAALLLAKELWSFCRCNRLTWLIIAYVTWMSLSLFWSREASAMQGLWQLFLNTAAFSFVAVSAFLWIHHSDRISGLLSRVLWLAAAAAVASMVVFYLQHPFPQTRLEPLGVMHHQNKGGAAYGLLLLFCMRMAMAEHSARQRWWLGVTAVALGALVLLTQSRTALAAVCVGLAVVMGKRGLPWLVLGLAVSWGLVASNPETWGERVIGLSFRPGIWQQVLQDMQGHWLLGHGYLSDPRVSVYGKVFDHAHNGYLASLRDGGLVGVVLLALVLGTALFQAVRIALMNGERLYLAMLLYGMTCITMDFDRLLVHPKELWLFFWLPLALLVAVYPRRTSISTYPLAPVGPASASKTV